MSKKITILRDKDLEIISQLNKTTSDIAVDVVKKLYKDPIVSTTTIQQWIGQTKPGTMKFIGRLVDAGVLFLHRKGEGNRPDLYSHKRYLKIFTEN